MNGDRGQSFKFIFPKRLVSSIYKKHRHTQNLKLNDMTSELEHETSQSVLSLFPFRMTETG